MEEKLLKAKIIHKHELEVDWLKSTYIPRETEIVVYDKEVDEDGHVLCDKDGKERLPEGRWWPYKESRFKIGDGKRNVNELPFFYGREEEAE